MPLSSNSLIHLTENKEALKGILQNNFKVQYCLEKITTMGGSFQLAIPMVSFCDIPLSEIKNHISKYGKYGLGLNKDWAIRNKLNPILYIEKGSELGNRIRRTFMSTAEENIRNNNNSEIIDTIINLFQYMKNYQDDLERGGDITPNYRFSDEREWRYVPQKNEANMFIPISSFNTDNKKRQANNSIDHLKLSFTPSDITYIFIKDDSEINEFIDVLRSAKGKFYTQHEVEKLMTRIFTTKQIETDI